MSVSSPFFTISAHVGARQMPPVQTAETQSDPALQRLPSAQQKSLTDAAAAAEKRGWQLSREREANANKLLGDNGMTIHMPDAAMLAALNKVGDTMTAEWLKSAGTEGEAIVKAYRGK
jgi:TRAP-type C4-dicarboxylate transport system substrate-binding protein